MRKITALFCVLVLVASAFAAVRYRNITMQNSTVDSTPVGATTPSTGAFTTLSVSTSMISAPGLQFIKNAASCTTPAALNGSCNTAAIAWPQTWPNATYAAVCSFNYTTGSPGSAMVTHTGTRTTTVMDVEIGNANGSTTAIAGTISCVGWE